MTDQAVNFMIGLCLFGHHHNELKWGILFTYVLFERKLWLDIGFIDVKYLKEIKKGQKFF